MMNSVQKRRLAVFKNSCRVYQKEQERSLKLSFLYPDLKEMVQIDEHGEIHETSPVFLGSYSVDPLMIKEYEFILYDIWFVEDQMNTIEKSCGTEAKQICTELFVKQQTQEICAQDHGMTRDQLQHHLNQWIQQSFGA
ncbi:hypothetical protein [Anaerolactibacter massiliensis]|uniref:hypothetical protein n=1 Tax=Anaerolactibacter massiliensis TaxID=2044573 RepID=UPI000CFA511D|nr:hypothetical protein [Anaerolactibacter massiliensis]